MKVYKQFKKINYCAECPNYRNYEFKSYCIINKKDIGNYYTTPDDCPLEDA